MAGPSLAFPLSLPEPMAPVDGGMTPFTAPCPRRSAGDTAADDFGRGPLLRALVILLAFLATPLMAERITVFAAASLGPALVPLAEDWEAETGTEVRLSLAGTPVLARQIMAGAPADLFLAASPDWMDAVVAAGLVEADDVRIFARNRLHLIAPAGAPPIAELTGEALLARLDGGRLAVAETTSVPAGIYGRAALEALDLWPALSPHLAQTDNVRGALLLVALGEAPLGVVYASDAATEPRVQTLVVLPEDSHPPILYPAAPLNDSPDAAAFLEMLLGPRGQVALAEAGFLTAEGG